MTQQIAVTLTFPEMLLAWQVAAMRRVSNLKNKVSKRYGIDARHDTDETDVMSCQGEMAVAKALNLFWSGAVNDFSAHDVGGAVEVRTVTASSYRLILHKSDHDHLPYVLVDQAPPVFTLAGWIYGRDGKRAEFWSDPAGNRPAFFVPRSALRPMGELIDILPSARRAAA